MNELKELENYLETIIDDCEEAQSTALAQQLAYEAILRKVKFMMKEGE
ncbi:TPA: hypothetical protein IAC10_04310 [Candidatus Scatousia excrementigallinarum]|uniref:Uncharacterized protein n=1 Tax=Candidatus Scatousia excrementigallinarum TaxID=2840935 RepID=A0A9D1JMA7_9BACT|nr:hypothetical protein [Candidatus Scatousia excrementigallinarum]